MLWCTYRYSHSYAVTGDSGESPAHRQAFAACSCRRRVVVAILTARDGCDRTGDSLPSMQSCDSFLCVKEGRSPLRTQ